MTELDKAYHEGYMAAPASLVLGVEVSRDGAAVCLISKTGEDKLILKNAFVLNGKPVLC